MDQCTMPAESANRRELKNETAAGSLGLGVALAVAYDLIDDPSFSYAYPETVYPSEARCFAGQKISAKNYQPTFITMSPQNQFGTVSFAQKPTYSFNGCDFQNCIKPDNCSLSTPGSNMFVSNGFDNATTIADFNSANSYQFWHDSSHISESSADQTTNYTFSPLLNAYLNPISAAPNLCLFEDQQVSSTISPMYYQSISSANSIADNGTTSESAISPDSLMSNKSDGNPRAHANERSSPNSRCGEKRFHNCDAIGLSSTASDDSLYELSEDDLKEIDEMLTSNPQVTSSRHWKYYTETNEWTRATCALMACLFSRDQMANSTVLGRGGSQRERLPTNLVAYVVTKMRRRFNKPAAAVRARMAQKCKDERRFGHVLPPCYANQPSAVTGRLSLKSSGNRRRGTLKSQRVAKSAGGSIISKSANGVNPDPTNSEVISPIPEAFVDHSCSYLPHIVLTSRLEYSEIPSPVNLHHNTVKSAEMAG